MALTAHQRYTLKKVIKDLEQHRGRHTELVTVYIPSGYDINKVTSQLAQEQGTATNIKSTGTRKNVIDALEKMIQHLRLYNKTPENGLTAFAGNVAEREGQSDVKVWSIEPPVPLKIRIYRCDKTFVLEPLLDMVAIKEMYGLVVMDRREATIAVLKGKTITPVSSATSNVPGKTKAGGQSAHRYERLREDAAKDFFKKVGSLVKDEFFGKDGLKGIIIGGPGPTKHTFAEGDYITNELKKKIIAIKDISYTDEFGLQELLEKSEDVLANEEVAGEKQLMRRFFEILSTTPNKISYGEQHVRNAINQGAVELLLLSEELDEKLVDELEEMAKSFGTKVQIISTETREGVQLRDLGKVAAILRYELSQ